MKINLIGHASIKVSTKSEKTLVTDPWLISPCFWSSWFHLPEPVYDDSIFDTDFIYFTHWHFDHFDYKSIRKFNRNCQIYVPKFPSSILKRELNKMGFNYVTEMIHNKKYKLDDNLEITSHQIEHHDDSVLCINADNKIILNLNDAKPMPSSWKWLINHFYKPDFIFRSHSLAWSFPTRYVFEDKKEAEKLDQDLYIQEFIQACDFLSPKYAVPFASYICHPHKENLDQNHHLITPYMIEDYLKNNPLKNTKYVIMNPGGKFDDTKGFYDITHYKFDELFKMIKSKNQSYLERVYKKENNHNFNYGSVTKYFDKFFKSTFIFSLFLKKTKWIIDCDLDYKILIDFDKKKVSKINNIDEVSDKTALIKTHRFILEDSLNKLIFSNIDVAKRWDIFIYKNKLQKHLFLTALISIYEAGVIPLYKNIYKPRFIIGYLRRLPEIIDYIKVVFKFSKSVSEAREYVSGIK